MSTSSILAQSFVANGIFNLDSKRFASPTLDQRKRGWTESWGVIIEEGDADNYSSSMKEYHERLESLDNTAISTTLLSTPYPQQLSLSSSSKMDVPITLFQYRPAWTEQVVLQMLNIPHFVVNCNYVSMEATGPLPCLRELSKDSSSTHDKPSILVGRHHTSRHASPAARNHILEYLLYSKGGHSLDNHLSPRQRAQSTIFETLIQSELHKILLFLRYEDLDAWEQVYRPQVLLASGSHSYVAQMGGRVQAWSERAMGRRQLGEAVRSLSIAQAIERAKQIYASLESQLDQPHQEESSNSTTFLLGLSQPSLVDAFLFEHLAHALCDVHLVVCLADFPNIVTYFSNMCKLYFGNNDAGTPEWIKWNRRQNRENTFHQLPFARNRKSTKPHFKDAIELMQSLSVRIQKLQEVLVVTKQTRVEEPWPAPSDPTKSNLYYWRHGGDLTKRKSSEQGEDPAMASPQRKKMIRDQQRNDQTWVSGVLGVSALAIILLRGMQKES
jgi:hypothetical protein